MKEKELFEIFGVKDRNELDVYFAKETEKLVEKFEENIGVKMAKTLIGFGFSAASSEQEEKEIAETGEKLMLQLAMAEGMGFILDKLTESEKEGTEA